MKKLGYIVLVFVIVFIFVVQFMTVHTMDLYKKESDAQWAKTQEMLSGFSMEKKVNETVVNVLTGTMDAPESTGDYDMGDEGLNNIFGL